MNQAYLEDYLPGAMRNLAVMMDCGVNKYGLDIDAFYDMFLQSPVSQQFAQGNPNYIAGHSGAELADLVVEYAGKEISEANDGTYNVGPDFWTGWALAYYQWRTNSSFQALNRQGLTAPVVRAMYYPLHEADLEKFAESADQLIQQHT